MLREMWGEGCAVKRKDCVEMSVERDVGGGMCSKAERCVLRDVGGGMCVLTAEFVYRVRQVMQVRMVKLVLPAPKGRWE